MIAPPPPYNSSWNHAFIQTPAPTHHQKQLGNDTITAAERYVLKEASRWKW